MCHIRKRHQVSQLEDVVATCGEWEEPLHMWIMETYRTSVVYVVILFMYLYVRHLFLAVMSSLTIFFCTTAPASASSGSATTANAHNSATIAPVHEQSPTVLGVLQSDSSTYWTLPVHINRTSTVS